LREKAVDKKENKAVANVDAIVNLIISRGWSRTYFSKTLMGKNHGWLTDLKRKGCIVFLEDAAKICILLKTTPEEILMHEGKNEEETQKCKEDIELVRELVEKQKEAPAEKGEGLTDTQKTAIDFVLSLPPEKLKKFIKLAQAVFEDEQHD
jgi:hypothetical protein